jgi:hypothetical protein
MDWDTFFYTIQYMTRKLPTFQLFITFYAFSVLFITCICYLYFRCLYSLFIHLLFYHCKLYCTAFYYSCIMSVIFVVIRVCVMFWFWPVFIFSRHMTDAGAIKLMCVCVNKTKTLNSAYTFTGMNSGQNIFFYIYIYIYVQSL